MPVSTDNKLNPQRKQARQTLLGFLLGLLELETEPAKSLDRLLPLDLSHAIMPGTLRDNTAPIQADLSEDELDGLTDTGAYIGLRMERVVLTPSAAQKHRLLRRRWWRVFPAGAVGWCCTDFVAAGCVSLWCRAR